MTSVPRRRSPPEAARPAASARDGSSMPVAGTATATPARTISRKWEVLPSPAPAASALRTAPAVPPRLYMAWKPDMTGRPSRRSTVTPWAFMATSTTLLTAARRNSPAVRVARSPASAGPARATT
ncbi:MAG TPA: hypothetical protein VFU54_08340 [Actinomycetota bacterium]|nr:hypothetical protein [Actinomycetota bacterium]